MNFQKTNFTFAVRAMTFSLLFSLLPLSFISAQTKQQDSLAILLIDRMTDIIGDLESCSYKLNVTTDVPDVSFGLVKHLSNYEVYMSGPSKLLINSHGDRGHHQYFYNGQQFATYSFDENNYGILPVADNTIQTIDSLNKKYGIEFPAADFFYPAFTDDLLGDAGVIKFLGIVRTEGKEYFHIMASGTDKNYEFWINNDAFNLPAKFAITYKTQKGNPQYQATFSDWEINPALPSSMFDFLPPPGARQVKIMSQNEK